MNMIDILTSGHSFSEEETPLKLKYMLFNLLLLSNIGFAFILFIIRIVQGEMLQMVMNGSYLLFGGITILLTRKDKAYFDTIVSVVILISYLFATAIFYYLFNEMAGVSWYIMLVIVAVIFKGRTAALNLFLLSVITVVWIALVHHHIPLGTVLTGLIPFLSSLFIIIVFDMFQESMRRLIEKQKEKYIQLSRRDALINIPNRAYFLEHFSQILEPIRNGEDAPGVALLFIDVDRFKSINDRFGHPVGDTVLMEVGKRLKSRLRRNDMVARYGGDEFAVIVSEVYSHLALRRMLDRLMTDMNRPFVVGDWRVDVSLSIGVVMIPQDGTDEVELLKEADQAMYAAKKERGNSYRFYQDIVEDQTSEHRGGHWAAWRAS
jgi:diguanylate cyclase (GGDEF)-like protein